VSHQDPSSDSTLESSIRSRRFTYLRAGLFIVTVLADQLTKVWARRSFSLPNGEPDYFLTHPVIGEWLQFRLVYNFGAAFGMKPQSLLPFLHPTLFFGLFSANWRLGLLLPTPAATGELA
jgi:lipoprotein signal peptidase